jgi:hypothetical protein
MYLQTKSNADKYTLINNKTLPQHGFAGIWVFYLIAVVGFVS